MPTDSSERMSPAPKSATIAQATDLREDQLRETEESIAHQRTTGTRMPVHPPHPLNISGRVLVATFLLPYEATIDLEEGRVWVPSPSVFLTKM
jgi:hypothetical protein